MALTSLETKGFIRRRIDKDDRRKVIVSITEEGRRLVMSERREMRGQNGQKFSENLVSKTQR
jgi:DNA-binding MarR family transcriptional regulator